MHICVCSPLEFRRIMPCQSSFTLFITDSKIRLQVHVSFLILARWNLFASNKRQQQQLSHCHGASVLFLMQFWNVAEVVLRERGERVGVVDERTWPSNASSPEHSGGSSFTLLVFLSFLFCSYYPQKKGFYWLFDYLCIEEWVPDNISLSAKKMCLHHLRQ